MTTVYQAPAVQVWESGMALRDCGTCNVCCKLPGIPETGKPPGVWCEHCEPGSATGCRVYERRPAACDAFHCLWRVMPTFPEELRPDRCKVMWTMTEDGRTAIATTEYPERLDSLAQRWVVEQFRRQGVAVRIAKG